MSINLNWRPPKGKAPFIWQDTTFTKHYGPGPHPGTGTPQSIHGGAAGLTLEDPNVTVSRTLTDNIPYFETAARNAVVKFRFLYPDSGLGPVNFSPMVFPLDEETVAYVASSDPNTVKFHIDTWKDKFMRDTLEAFKQGNPHQIAYVEVGRANGWSEKKMLEALLFHETVHVAELASSPIENGSFPTFSREWYPVLAEDGTVQPSTDPNLPSRYAAHSSAEFFAEAITDHAYFGDRAHGHSKLTAERYRHYLKELNS